MKKAKAILTLLIVVLFLASGVAKADWVPADGHKMHYPQLPDPDGWDVLATMNGVMVPPLVLADDFMCMETGYITDIHFWGSWLGGITGAINGFILSIHADIPYDPPLIPYSRPLDPPLWEMYVPAQNIVINGPMPGIQGWYDPYYPSWVHPDHVEYYQYNVFLDDFLIPEELFWQEEGTIYWLNITADLLNPFETVWGWKTTLNPWNDGAVWSMFPPPPPPLTWEPLYDEGGFTLDLAFVITGGTEAEGACCYPEPTGGPQMLCIVTTQANCEDLASYNGIYQGDGTVCGGMEACCVQGTCVDADALCCENELGGTPQGAGTVCTATEACCFSDGSCMDLDPLCCDDMGGALSPTGATACLGDVSPANGIDDACEEVPIEPKWQQPPNMGFGLCTDCHTPYHVSDWQSNHPAGPNVADDFQCNNPNPIVKICWWGSYMDGLLVDPHPKWLKISFHDYDGSCEPPPPPVWGVCLANETYYGMTAGGEDIYYYCIDGNTTCQTEILPWEQVPGTKYWLDIAYANDYNEDERIWGWHESDTQWNCPAVQSHPPYNDGDPQLGPWFPLDMFGTLPPIDMSFELYAADIPDLCQEYLNKLQCCNDMVAAGREIDYDVCKTYTDETTCESNGCTWHPDGNPAGNCILDVCLTEVSGDDKVTAPDYSIFKKEFGRSGCPCVTAPGDDLCDKYACLYDYCMDLNSSGRETDYDVCKTYTDQTTCESNGCTWHPDLNPAGNCMLDVCLTEVSGDDKVTAPDYSVFKKEFGRSGCPCAIP